MSRPTDATSTRGARGPLSLVPRERTTAPIAPASNRPLAACYARATCDIVAPFRARPGDIVGRFPTEARRALCVFSPDGSRILRSCAERQDGSVGSAFLQCIIDGTLRVLVAPEHAETTLRVLMVAGEPS